MPTPPTNIDALLSVRSEGEHLEFKTAENRYDFEELVDYCVALANEGGGRIILGVTDKPPRRVFGTKAFEIPERTVGGLYERLQLKITFEEIAHAGGRVLVFHVPSRPMGQPVHYKGRYLMRAGEELGTGISRHAWAWLMFSTALTRFAAAMTPADQKMIDSRWPR